METSFYSPFHEYSIRKLSLYELDCHILLLYTTLLQEEQILNGDTMQGTTIFDLRIGEFKDDELLLIWLLIGLEGNSPMPMWSTLWDTCSQVSSFTLSLFWLTLF